MNMPQHAWTCPWALAVNSCSASLSTHGSTLGLQSFDSCQRRLRDLLQNTEDCVHLVRPLLKGVRDMRANISIVGSGCCGAHYKCHEACEHKSNTSIGNHLNTAVSGSGSQRCQCAQPVHASTCRTNVKRFQPMATITLQTNDTIACVRKPTLCCVAHPCWRSNTRDTQGTWSLQVIALFALATTSVEPAKRTSCATCITDQHCNLSLRTSSGYLWLLLRPCAAVPHTLAPPSLWLGWPCQRLASSCHNRRRKLHTSMHMSTSCA